MIITQKDAQHTLWYFGSKEDGYQPGGFTSALIDAITKADEFNRRRLFKVYPGLVTAVQMAKNEEDGMDKLRQIAGRG